MCVPNRAIHTTLDHLSIHIGSFSSIQPTKMTKNGYYNGYYGTTMVVPYLGNQQTHYRQGSKMLLADPLSRLCSPSSGFFFDPMLPAKLQALLRYLPEDMKNHENVRVYAFKDTAALSRHIQQWRTPKNPISQGRLSSATAKNSFHIGILHSDGNFRELLDLLVGILDLPYMWLFRYNYMQEYT